MTHRDEDEEIIDNALDTLAWQRREIDRLKEQVERLREALKDALSHCYNCSGDPHYIEEDEATGDHLWTDCPVCRSARAALGEK